MKRTYIITRCILALGIGCLLTLSVFIGSSLSAQLPVASAAGTASLPAAPGDTFCVAVISTTYPGCTRVFTNVQAAVDSATGLETIKVSQGTYTSLSTRPIPDGYVGLGGDITQVVFISKTVFIQGGYTTANWITPDPVAHPTTLDAQSQGRVVLIAGNITPTLTGLRLINGNAAGLGGFDNLPFSPPDAFDAGGGVYIISATATLSNDQVISNTASTDVALFSYGGGVHLNNSPSILYGNTITGGTAEIGGGVALLASDATLSHNSINNNTVIAGGYGGGIYLETSSGTLDHNFIMTNTSTTGSGGGVTIFYDTPLLTENTIAANTAPDPGAGGGGVYLYFTEPTFRNNLIANNQVGGLGAGVYVSTVAAGHFLHTTLVGNFGGDGSGVYLDNSGRSTVWLTNTILISQSIGVFADTGTTANLESTLFGGGTNTSGTGTINVSNSHAGNPAFVNPSAGNYHITGSSAAIDQGINAGVTTDIDGDPRPLGLGFDLGADEFYNPAVSLTKSTSASSAQPGAVITYTLRVTNTGNVTLTTFLSDTLPLSVTFKGPVTVSPAGGSTGTPPGVAGGQSIGPGKSITVSFPVTLSTGAGMSAGSIIVNSAAITTSPSLLTVQPLATTGVSVLNAPPVAADDVYTTSISTAIAMSVLDNDTDANGDTLTVSAVGTPLNGIATINSGVSVIYTPTTGFAGTNVFTYTARDPGGLLSTASITVTVANIPISGLTTQNSSPTTFGASTHFTATVTAGSSVAYTWNFGDGGTTTGQFASHTYSTAGNFTAIVTATNNLPGTASTTTAVTITKATPAVAITAHSPDPSVVGQNVSITFTVTSPGVITPTGTVTVTDGSQSCTAILPTTACSIAFTSIGLKTLTAQYGGDSNFNAVISTGAGHTVNDVPISGLAAQNSGPGSPGSNVFFTATIAAGTNVAYQWDFGDGGAGSSANTTHSYAASGNYLAVVTATNGSGSQVATTTVTVLAQAGLSLIATDAPDPASIGKPLVYTLVIRNNGPTNADTVVVTDTLPAGVTFGSATATQGTCITPTVTCNIGTLINSGTVTVTIVVTPSMSITSPVIITNSAGVSSTTADPNPADNTSTITTTIDPRRLFLPLIRR